MTVRAGNFYLFLSVCVAQIFFWNYWMDAAFQLFQTLIFDYKIKMTLKERSLSSDLKLILLKWVH